VNEQELYASTAPNPRGIEELSHYILELTDQQHDYGTCVYAMSLSAMATFNYVANKLGVTGFQASCADMDFLRRSRNIDGPFMLVRLQDALYPQTDFPIKLAEFQERNWLWLRAQAIKKMAQSPDCHPDVFHRWLALSERVPTSDEDVAIWNKLAPDDPITDAGEYARLALENHRHGCAHLSFLRAWNHDQTEEFVEKHAADFIQFGIKRVHLFEGGTISKAESVKEGGSYRIGLPVSLEFNRTIGALLVTWSEDTELPGSNGASWYRFDFAKLDTLEEQSIFPVAEKIRAYIEKARRASESEAAK